MACGRRYIRGGMVRRNFHDTPQGWNRYEDERRGFSLTHPSDWEVLRGAGGLLVSVAAPAPPSDAFRSNMNVVRRVLDTSLDLEGFAQSALASLVRLLNEPIVIDVDTDVIAEHPARRLLVAYRQGLYALTTQQWLFRDDEHVWTISAGALTERWDQDADAFTDVAHSFRLGTS